VRIYLNQFQMGRHLLQCTKLDNKENQAFLLKVTANNSAFWMFLKVRQNCTLESLDSFLRDVWLECCGHLSHFIIDGTYYEKTIVEGFEDGSLTMKGKIKNILHHKMRFSYEYDYGSTTVLRLEVHHIINDDSHMRKPIVLLARNNPIKIACDSCKNTATSICAMCMYDDSGFLCRSCVKKYVCDDCDDEPSFLPVLNSPRMGVCAYNGNASNSSPRYVWVLDDSK